MADLPVDERRDAQDKLIRSFRDYMARYFPKRLAELEREGRCIHCGAEKKDTRHA